MNNKKKKKAAFCNPLILFKPTIKNITTKMK